jgi:hypothetical protein
MGGIFFNFQPQTQGGIWGDMGGIWGGYFSIFSLQDMGGYGGDMGGGYFSIFSLKRSTPCLTEVSPVKRSGGWSQSWMVTLLKELTFGGTAAG